MTLLGLIVVLVVVGLLLWGINRFIPMEARIKSILNAVVIVVVVLWLLGVFFGGFGHIVSAANIQVPTFNNSGCTGTPGR